MFLRALHYSVTLLAVSALVLVIQVLPGRADQKQNGVIEIRGMVVDEAGHPIPQMPIRCQDKPSWSEKVLREVRSDDKGAFVLTALPANTDWLHCTSGGSIYELLDRIIPVKEHTDTEVIFTLNFRTISVLQGWITSNTRGELPNALVRVTLLANGTTVSRRADGNGKVRFENLKAGPARVEYSADGYTGVVWDAKNFVLVEGSDLSISLTPFWFPPGLILLIPAILVLTLRAGMEWWQHKLPKEQRTDLNPMMILACLAGWGIALFCLWRMPGGDESISFFNPRLSFSLLVPAFGFVGALVFVIDIFQSGKQNAADGKEKENEFALRLVLGPYVAIVMVLLFKDTFKFVEIEGKLETQATLAFFSGFLVVLALQGVTEKGNEILGRWRATNRYEPSEIATRFKLDLEEDLKLRKANLKYLTQLRTIPAAELRTLAKMTDLSEGLLVGMQRELRLDHLRTTLGEETWDKLYQEGVRTVYDMALQTPARIQDIATKREINEAVLQKFYTDCQTFVQES